MNKMLATAAAAAMLAALTLPAPATAAERPDAGIHKQVTDFSSQRVYVRHRHYVRRYVRPRYYGGYYADPYYSSYGYPYYRPYPYYGYGPGVGVRVGPFGFGIW